MQDVPIEIQQRIFDYLDKRDILECALSSRKMSRVAFPVIWNCITCFADSWEFNSRVILNEFKQSSGLKALSLSLLNQKTIESGQAGRSYANLIHSLALKASSPGWSLGDTKLAKFRQSLQKLTNLTSLNVDFPCLNDNDLWLITKNSDLKCISFVSGVASHCRITDEGLVALSNNSKSLREIYISSRWIDAEILDEVSGKPFLKSVFTARGIKALSTLTNLKGFGLKYIGVDGFLTNNHGLSKGSEQNNPIFIRSIQDFISSNSQLSKLIIDWPGLLPTVSEIVANSYFKLSSFMLGNLYESDKLDQIIQHNTKLTRIDLIDVHVQLNLFNSLTLVANPLELSSLVLLGIGYSKNVLEIFQAFSNLTCLKIRPSTRAASIHHASDDDALSKALRCLPKLNTLEAVIITNLPLETVANNCKFIENIEIIDGKQVTNQGVCKLGTCSRLETLSLGHASLTDEFAESLPLLLTRLVLPPNNQLTVKSMESLVRLQRLMGLANIPESVEFNDLMRLLPLFPRLLIISKVSSSAIKSKYLNSEQVQQLKKKCLYLKQVHQSSY